MATRCPPPTTRAASRPSRADRRSEGPRHPGQLHRPLHQARVFWHSQSPVAQDHIVSAAHFELGKVEHLHIRQGLVDLFSHVDQSLAEKIAAGIGIREITSDLSYLEDVMTTPVRLVDGVAEPGRAPSLSLQHSTGSARTCKTVVLVADGVSGADVEASAPRSRRLGRRPCWWARSSARSAPPRVRCWRWTRPTSPVHRCKSMRCSGRAGSRPRRRGWGRARLGTRSSRRTSTRSPSARSARGRAAAGRRPAWCAPR
jgi:hypothetical protein